MVTIAQRPQCGPAREYHFPRFTRDRLENGLNVIVSTVSKLPIVSVAVVVDATALADDKGKEGMAELTAQALREGSAARDGVRLSLDLEKLGTSLEAGADWDNTVVSMTVLKDKLEAAFAILAEVVLSPAFDEDDVARLKVERLAERMQILDEPRGLADESFAGYVYADRARFSKPMSGTTKSVSAIRRADLESFYKRNYFPQGTTLIFVGDIRTDEAMRLAESAFGGWKGEQGPLPVNADSPARDTRAIEIVARPEAAQSEVRIGHVGVPRSHPDYFRIVVMNAVLGGLFSSRINLNLREVHGYTYGASSYFDWRRQSGPFAISTAVQSEVTGAAISETLKEIDRMRDEEIGEDELTLATSYLEGVFPIRYETTAAIASALANLATFGLPEDYYDTYRENIAAVTTRHVLNAARKYVKPEELQIVVVGAEEIIREQLEKLGIGPVSVNAGAEA